MKHALSDMLGAARAIQEVDFTLRLLLVGAAPIPDLLAPGACLAIYLADLAAGYSLRTTLSHHSQAFKR